MREVGQVKMQTRYLGGCQHLKESQLVSGAEFLIELVHSTSDSLFYRWVITEDQDTLMDLQYLLDMKKKNKETYLVTQINNSS